MIDVCVSEAVIDPEARVAALRDHVAGRAGAVVSFSGSMRGEEGQVTRLILDHYPGYTDGQVRKICEGAADRFHLLGLSVQHRVGSISPGEVIVVVACAAAHRREAFEACDFVMDYLKSAAPFWKKEVRADGARWIEPTARDLADRQRWETS